MAGIQHEPRVIGGSHRISAVEPSRIASPDIKREDDNHHEMNPKQKLIDALYTVETDLQAGANHRYEVNVHAMNDHGKHLSELCKAEYPIFVKYCLWLLAEVAVIAADIPEGTNLIGTAFALNILFNIPVWVGVLLTGFSTLLLLGLQRYGVRKLEILIALLVFVMAGCFFGEMSYVKPPAADVLKGMFIPKLGGRGATGDAIALLGALVMPHNLFLHSALVLSRKIPNSVRGINVSLFESGIALFVAFLINVSIIAVSGTVCSAENLPSADFERCSDLSLDSASFLLKNVLGKSSSTLYAIALLASGQSSTITGTYAGQFIMQTTFFMHVIVGFFGFKDEEMAQELDNKMHCHHPESNSIDNWWVVWCGTTNHHCIGLGIIGINIYYLTTSFVDWLIHSSLPKVANVFIGIIVFPIMAVYILSVLYLMFRKDVVVTFVEPTKRDPNAQVSMENGENNTDKAQELTNVPYREDLADIPFPE
ncbi:Natural resistance-associated macrophage protein [Cynara cardunculus var. scolymus]|uniref:Natural resistance-associated macrophage protein n=1 Tax=Cynara cardunculus var. scolymus TaxID=59895 RepID=A0A118JW32_CYNCS|nr:Natural resistance-associated macrophage protein [Cynara cardunculus var. scolymus]